MPNYKQLCADLVDALTAHAQPDDDAVGYVAELLICAHAALAEPEPPSLKAQALAALNEIEDEMLGPTVEEKLIRHALESLPN